MSSTLCWGVKTFATSAEVSFTMFPLYMHCQRYFRLEHQITRITIILCPSYMQLLMQYQGSQCWVTLVTDITLLSLSMNSYMFSHSCMYCRHIIAKLAVNSQRLVHNRIVGMQICYYMIWFLTSIAEVQTCIWMIFILEQAQKLASSHTQGIHTL